MNKIEKVLKNLKERNMEGFCVKSGEEAVEKVLSLIDKKKQIGFGWSTTNFEIGLIDKLREKKYNLLDRFDSSLDRNSLIDILDKTQQCEILITGTNAITEDGKLVNSDGMGTRVAPMIYGPECVIVIVGKNKITKDVNTAFERIKQVAAPKNAIRKSLDLDNQRVMTKLMSYWAIIEFQYRKERIKVIIIDKEHGF
tara:strand:- start:1147 stop:1737 length:591 start_codon:yes stop_codon:yes gene_type:complete